MKDQKIQQTLTIVSIALALFGGLILWRELLGNAPIPGIYSYMYLSSVSFSMRLVSVAVSLASVLLVVRLLNIHAHEKYRLIAAIMFVIAPSTIVLSAVFSPYSAALSIVLLSLNLLHTRIKIIALFPIIAVAFIDWISFLCSMILCASYMIYNEKKDLIKLIPAAVIGAIITIVEKVPYTREIIHNSSFIQELFSELGGLYGLSLFMTLLAIAGIIVSWPHKKKLIGAYAAIIIISILSIWSSSGMLFLSPIIILFAAYAFLYFWEREWSLPFIRFLTLAVIIYGILFSSIAVMNELAEMPPSKEVIESVEWLRRHPFYSDDIVLSHPEKGYWIDYGATPFITYNDKNFSKKLNITEEILLSRDYKTTTELLENNSISIIWIDKQMKNGQVWTSDDEGLLYLFSDPRFLKVYDTEEVEIWRFK